MNKSPAYEIVVSNYDPQWPQIFTELKEIFKTALGELALRIEHVGSTSVPGLAAKPTIDIDVVIESPDLLPQVAEKLAKLGYIHNGDQGIPGREAFLRPDPSVPHTDPGRHWMRHNLYVCAKDARELARHTAFRDYLRQHPEAVQEYSALKRQLAQQFTFDIDGYVDGKSDFIQSIYRRTFNP